MLHASIKSLTSLIMRWKYGMDSPSFCASPNHLLIRLDILTLMKTAPDSLAIALASIVFPVPGGPYKRTPFWGPSSFPWENSSGLRSGRITNSYKACLMVSNPPIELNSTSMWSGFITSHAITSCRKKNTQVKNNNAIVLIPYMYSSHKQNSQKQSMPMLKCQYKLYLTPKNHTEQPTANR